MNSLHLVLIGGGHTHSLLLAQLRQRPIPGVIITLLDTNTTAPYTGMLPGYIAGHYERADLLIDLERLAVSVGATFQVKRVVHINPNQKVVTTQSGEQITYDVVSIDIGIHSNLTAVTGAAEHTVHAKPLYDYASQWQMYVASSQRQQAFNPMAIIGGGEAGVELALAMQYRASQEKFLQLTVTIIDQATIMQDVAQKTRHLLRQELNKAGVQVREQVTVSAVTETEIHLANNEVLPSDFTVSAIGARPYGWLENTTLPLTKGFITVDATLRSVAYPSVFAVGDCAHFSPQPLPKAGVYAVRQAVTLHQNLRAVQQNTKLQAFQPQADYLKLISLGDKRAVADKYGWSARSALLWHLKNWIDQRFMQKLRREASDEL